MSALTSPLNLALQKAVCVPPALEHAPHPGVPPYLINRSSVMYSLRSRGGAVGSKDEMVHRCLEQAQGSFHQIQQVLFARHCTEA